MLDCKTRLLSGHLRQRGYDHYLDWNGTCKIPQILDGLGTSHPITVNEIIARSHLVHLKTAAAEGYAFPREKSRLRRGASLDN